MKFNLKEKADICEEYSEYFTDLLFIELGSAQTTFFTTRDITLADLVARRTEIKEIIYANVDEHVECFVGDDYETVVEDIDDNMYLCTPIIMVAKDVDENNNPIDVRHALNVVIACNECSQQKEDDEVFSLSAFLNEIEV